MNFFLIYKGHYGSQLTGPEMRYVGLAKSLHKKGHGVDIACKSCENALLDGVANFVFLNSLKSLLHAFKRADVILLHGGGGWLLLCCIISSLIGKRIILDSYVPHWIELDEYILNKGGRRTRLKIKSHFNVVRTTIGILLFDSLIVANKRQLDLIRGMSSPFLRTNEFSRFIEIPFGISNARKPDRESCIFNINRLINTAYQEVKTDDFLVGWLGGVYGWFDTKSVIEKMSIAIESDKRIKLIIFGVDIDMKHELSQYIKSNVDSNIILLPWVPFEDRFIYWGAFNLSIVWGGKGYENDYASRTRNFDCMTLGLPVIQNYDDEWGNRIKDNNCGSVTTIDNLSIDILRLSKDVQMVTAMAKSMEKLSNNFGWDVFSDRLLNLSMMKKVSIVRRLIGGITICFLIIPILVFFLYDLLNYKEVKIEG